MKGKFELDPQEIHNNIEGLKKFMRDKGLDGFYISSFDPYLSEYVPLMECHRYYVTGFTGSVAEVFVPLEGKLKLYVDGRYHEQADLEVNSDAVEVVKCGTDMGITSALVRDIGARPPKKLGYEGNRTPYALELKFEECCPVQPFDHDELRDVLNFRDLVPEESIYFLPSAHRGISTEKKLEQVIKQKDQCYFLTALDDFAWISNCRGYQIPHLSTFFGRSLVVNDKVYIFVEKNSPVDESVKENSALEILQMDYQEMAGFLRQQKDQRKLQEVFIDPALINSADLRMIKNIFSESEIKFKKGGLVPFRSIKHPLEVKEFEDSFRQAEQAIFNTIKWVRKKFEQDSSFSELDFFNQANQFYREGGAKSQSFNTIAAVGANSSIIHFSKPSADIIAQKSDMMLLDSGGYYEGGFATDCTRTFLAGGKLGQASDEQKKIYSLVLKSMIRGHMFEGSPEVLGAEVDNICRSVIRDAGYNYNHGTGHGVGIHVHEEGIRFSTTSKYYMKERQVVSIEPGIYIPKFGGVRLENVVVIEKSKNNPGKFSFRPFVYLGFDPCLTDLSILDNEELQYLEQYNRVCKERGTFFEA